MKPTIAILTVLILVGLAVWIGLAHSHMLTLIRP